MKRFFALSFLMSVFVVSQAPVSFVCAADINTTLVSDDFNRADSTVVGNGWFNVVQMGDQLSIADGKLTNTSPSGAYAAVYRPLAARSGPITISADLSHESGSGGLLYRHLTQFFIKGDSAGNGYGVRFARGDINYPSYVELFDNGVMVAELPSSFQYGAQLHAVITFNPDGSVIGTVSQLNDTFDFFFPARAVVSAGENFTIAMGEFDANPNIAIRPWVDNVLITASMPLSDLVQSLIANVVSADLPRSQLNSYLANLQKVARFIDDGKITASLNQLDAFVRKVEHDFAQGELSAEQSNTYLGQAQKVTQGLISE